MKPAQVTAEEALQRLIDGNERFRRGAAHPRVFRRELLADLARGQHPCATILGCSDSRVPPEWIFDAGLGELFVVRVAGNVLSPEVAGSLQHAGSHLQTPLMVVLGYAGCGAVQAAPLRPSTSVCANGRGFRSWWTSCFPHCQILMRSSRRTSD